MFREVLHLYIGNDFKESFFYITGIVQQYSAVDGGNLSGTDAADVTKPSARLLS